MCKLIQGDFFMIPLLVRGIIVYVVVIVSVRLMGKRQIGELQPAELVVTILLSEIAAMPLENSETPLIQSLVSILLLVSLEVVFSVVSLKSRSLRTLMQGHSVMVINNGKIVQKNLKLIRYSIDDLMEALRLKDVFDISTVQYAYIETNGSISVMLKKKSETVTLEDLNIKASDKPIPCLVISDGKIVRKEFEICGLNDNKLNKILSKNNVEKQQVLLMTYAEGGKTNIVVKEDKKC